MTENKRFVKYDGNTIVDLKLVRSWIISNGDVDLLIKLLNELNEEDIKQQTQVKKVLKKQLDYYIERVLLLNQPYGDVTEAIHNIADELGVDLE